IIQWAVYSRRDAAAPAGLIDALWRWVGMIAFYEIVPVPLQTVVAPFGSVGPKIWTPSEPRSANLTLSGIEIQFGLAGDLISDRPFDCKPCFERVRFRI